MEKPLPLSLFFISRSFSAVFFLFSLRRRVTTYKPAARNNTVLARISFQCLKKRIRDHPEQPIRQGYHGWSDLDHLGIVKNRNREVSDSIGREDGSAPSRIFKGFPLAGAPCFSERMTLPQEPLPPPSYPRGRKQGKDRLS